MTKLHDNQSLNFAIVARTLVDSADRNTRFGEPADGRVRPLRPQVALVPDARRCGEQGRINNGRADDRANLPHRRARCIEEDAAGVLHEGPAATWMAYGRARAMASPLLLPRSRATIWIEPLSFSLICAVA